ncbi:MAG: hypothetical protein COB92_04850 [Robiginitomaculum sp.]|nr:MAG: hypothetical protein COB92_04850 [Robiginitomaculum sp.]
MRLVNKIGKFANKYRKDASGQFAVITAMVGLPILFLTASAVDINRAHGQDVGLRFALDAAALAAVIPDNMSNSERFAYAEEVFARNYFGGLDVDLNVGGGRELVTIEATAKVPTMISGIVGIDTVGVSENSAAELTRSDVVCVLALDPYGDRALEFEDQAIFNAPACSVQVNSVSPFAMVSGVVTPPNALSFCVAGISQGQFSPFVKNACSQVADPYVNLTPPADGTCISPGATNSYLGKIRSISGTVDTFGNSAVLKPGTYCNGMRIKGVNVTFLPGIYIIKGGQLGFSKGAQATGDRVTFVLKEKSSLKIERNALVNLRAPKTGATAGLVFFQVPYVPKVGKNPRLPSDVSTVETGGGLSIVGTAYFPTQALDISSDNSIVSESPSTSFIAYRLKFSGKSNTQVHVDHETGGVPPALPRSDEGARLVR